MEKKSSIGIKRFYVFFAAIGIGIIMATIRVTIEKKDITNLFPYFENNAIMHYNKLMETIDKGANKENYINTRGKIELSTKIISSHRLKVNNIIEFYKAQYLPRSLIQLLISIGFLISAFGCCKLYKWTIKTVFLTKTVFII